MSLGPSNLISRYSTAFRWAVRADAWLPFLAGVGALAWLFQAPATTRGSPGLLFDLKLMALLGGPVLIFSAAPYSLFSPLRRISTLWTVIGLTMVAAAHGLATALVAHALLTDPNLPRVIGTFFTVHAAVLLITSALGAALSADLWRCRNEPPSAAIPSLQRTPLE